MRWILSVNFYCWNTIIVNDLKQIRREFWLIFTCSEKSNYKVHVSAFFKPSKPVIPLFCSILENKFGHHTKIDKLLFISGWLRLKLFLLFSYLLSTFWLFTNQFSVIYLFTQSIISYLCCDNQMLAIYVSNYDATSTCQTTSKTIYKIIKIQFWNPHKFMFARFAFLLNY